MIPMRTIRLWALGLVLAMPLPTAKTGPADIGDPPARVARISYLQGSVSFQPAGDTGWSEATLNYTVTTGDRLYTEQASRAELEVSELAVRLSDATDLTVSDLTDHAIQLGLASGTLRVSIRQRPPDDSVEVDTPNGALTLLEPGQYRVDIAADSTTVVTVDRGGLTVSGGGVSTALQGGDAVRLSGTDPIQISNVVPLEQDAFDRWSADRDRRLVSSLSAQYVSPDVPGYEDLDDAGRWDESAEYGPVWYPAGLPAGWVPYRFGHWAWVDPWGWTWIDAKPWGFAPFHYGRWVFGGSAWGWVPGSLAEPPCYAPALVAFVDGSQVAFSVGVQAWFPLGPNEPYYRWYHHGGEYLRRVNAPVISNVTTIVNVTNITAIHYRNRDVATTAVPTPTFRGGQPIAPRNVRLTPEQLARAPIAPHPSVVPAASAASGGRPAPAPAAPRPARITGAVQRPAASPARAAPLVTRRPPPPANPPFATRQRAMQAHPGRPLEPQQVENLRAGRPAGPMRDQEFPPHSAPAPRAAPASRPSARPAARAAPRPGPEHRQ